MMQQLQSVRGFEARGIVGVRQGCVRVISNGVRLRESQKPVTVSALRT